MACEVNCDAACEALSFSFANTTEYSQPYIAHVSLFLFIVGVIHVLGSFLVFLYMKPRYRWLSKRSRFLALVSSLGCLLQMVGGTLDQAETDSCVVKIGSIVCVVPFCALAVLVKLLDFLNRNVFARAIVEYLRKMDADDKEQVAITAPLTVIEVKTSRGFSWKDWLVHNKIGIVILKRLASSKARVAFMVVFLFPFFVANAVEWATHPYLTFGAKCYGCDFSSPQRYLIFIGGVVIVSLCLITVWVVRKYPDPYNVLAEIRLTSIGGILALLGFELTYYYTDGDTSEYFSVAWIAWVGMNLIQLSTCTLPIIRALKEEKKRGAENARQSSTAASVGPGPSVKTILVPGSAALPDFEKYLITEFAVENLKMYLECQTWTDTFFDMTETAKRARAHRIVSYFVETNSVFYVNIPGSIRTAIIEQVNNTQVPLTVALFAQSQNEMLHMLQGAYLRFLTR